MRSGKDVSQLNSSGFVSRSPSGTQALLLFHFKAGARLAVRRFAPLAALAMALLLFLRPEFFAEGWFGALFLPVQPAGAVFLCGCRYQVGPREKALSPGIDFIEWDHRKFTAGPDFPMGLDMAGRATASIEVWRDHHSGVPDAQKTAVRRAGSPGFF